MNSNSENGHFFYLAFRIALLSGLGSFVVFFLVLLIHIPSNESFQFAFMASVAVLIGTYFTARSVLQRRINKIILALEHLSHKKFEDSQSETYHRRDELDDVILQLQKTVNLTEKELQRLNRLENYRKEFIGDISHELKTPIFAIQGFIETLLNGALHDNRVNRSFLEKAMKNVARLNTLTKDLMEISRLESGELRTELQSLVLRDLINEVVEHLQYKAQSEHITLKISDIDPSFIVVADRNQLRQVLINLIENAIKYNKPQGSVMVSARKHPKNLAKLLVSVTDTGLGIESHDIPRVTERFYRIDKSRSREKGGTGLGLSIVKHIIEAHHEQLIIESTPNKGSTFSFTLQLAEVISS